MQTVTMGQSESQTDDERINNEVSSDGSQSIMTGNEERSNRSACDDVGTNSDACDEEWTNNDASDEESSSNRSDDREERANRSDDREESANRSDDREERANRSDDREDNEERANGDACEDMIEEIEDMMCDVCGGTPCDWSVYGSHLVSEVVLMYEEDPDKDVDNPVDNQYKRKSAYRYYIYEKHGFLGKGKRVRIPPCVLDRIRAMWPDENNDYIGYYSN